MDDQKRKQCARCSRPVAACICGWIAPVRSDVALLILQHPMEVASAKGSARLLHLSVEGSEMISGEAFEPVQLKAQLYAGGRRPVLLYPELPGEQSLGLQAPPQLDAGALSDPASLRLVVLDGTWRKSRKMLYLNPLLQELPRLALRDMPPSRYRIRKAHGPDQLSTLEAACHALAQIDGNLERYGALLASFDRFTAHFAATGGRLGEAAQ